MRYIHLNPLRARLVKDLEELGSYPYSGHAVLMGKQNREWQEKDYIWGLFGETQRQGQVRYGSYIALGANQGRRPELVGEGSCALLEGGPR